MKIFTVDLVLNIADQIFQSWPIQPSLEWVKQAWEILIKSGFAEYEDDDSYTNVIMRALALNDFMSEFCNLVYQQNIIPDYWLILETFKIDFANISDHKLNIWLKNERYKILKTLLNNTEFIHNDLLLFLDLWDSLNLDSVTIEKFSISKSKIFRWFSDQMKQESNVINLPINQDDQNNDNNYDSYDQPTKYNINSYFEIEAFDLLETISEEYRDYLEDYSHYATLEMLISQDSFYQYIFHPFINLCQLISQELPSEFKPQICHSSFEMEKDIIFEYQDYYGEKWIGVREYFTLSKLLYLQLTPQGINLGCYQQQYQDFLLKCQQNNQNTFYKFIQKYPNYLINLKTNISFTKEAILSQTEGELIETIINFYRQYIPLILIFNPDHSLKQIEKYLEQKTDQITINLETLSEKFAINLTKLTNWLKTIERKKQIILQGSPGTGKTFLAQHLAQYLVSNGDGFMEIIQFHPSYAYEDFIQGIRPQINPNGQLEYKMISGRFLEFCQQAQQCDDLCVLIIDEINRANLAQVFGELMYLLEYRDQEIKLAGTNSYFTIPENVRIIGTMNTADRSIALVDHALRRRFAFITITPNYDLLRQYHQNNSDFPIEVFIKILQQLNQTINDPHYEVGVSFFLSSNLAEDLENIWTLEIEPYLEEYFFDQLDKINQFRWDQIQPLIIKSATG
jgi:hypothetical protein